MDHYQHEHVNIIKHILRDDDCMLFLCLQLKIEQYDEHYQAFLVKFTI